MVQDATAINGNAARFERLVAEKVSEDVHFRVFSMTKVGSGKEGGNLSSFRGIFFGLRMILFYYI